MDIFAGIIIGALIVLTLSVLIWDYAKGEHTSKYDVTDERFRNDQ